MSADKDQYYYQSHKLVLTRSAADCHAFAEEILAINPRVDMVFSPILDIEAVDFDVDSLHPNAALVTTSKNADDMRQRFANVPHYAIGGAPEIQDVAGLIKHIEAHHDKARPLVYLRGHDISFDLAHDLTQKGYKIEEHIVYKANTAQAITPECLAAIDAGHVAYISFFSARTAAAFADLLPEVYHAKLKPIKALCLSAGVVNSLAKLPWQDCLVTPNKTRAAMVELIQTLYESD